MMSNDLQKNIKFRREIRLIKSRTQFCLELLDIEPTSIEVKDELQKLFSLLEELLKEIAKADLQSHDG